MVSTDDEREFRGRIRRIDVLIQEIERFADPAARAHTKEIVQALLDLHGRGLERVLDHIAEAGESGLATIDRLAEDDLVGSLLLLYGLHPLDIDARVRRALEQVRPDLRSHGGGVELVDITDGVVRLRMQGSCHGCPSSALTLKLAIEDAIYEQAPDVTSIEVDGVTGAPDGPPPVFVPMEQLRGANGQIPPRRS